MDGRKVMLAAVALLGLTGCSMKAIEATDVALEQARAESRSACVRARADAEQARMSTIAGMDPGAQGYAIMADAMARQAEYLAGKDPCATGMGAYEARVAEVRDRNDVVKSLGGKLITGSVVGAGIYTAGRLGEKAIENAGDKVSIQGDNNGYAQERVSSNADVTAKNFGENGTATSGAPSVTGPDKSTSTVHEAPAEPEVPEEVEEGEFVPTEPPAEFDDEPIDIPEIPAE